jgi:hypothetical protein
MRSEETSRWIFSGRYNSVTYLCVTIDGVWIDELYLLTTYTRSSELQEIAALSLSPHFTNQYTLSLFPACCVSSNLSLATASNSGVSSASHAHITVRRISRRIWTHPTNCSAISSQPPVQNSLIWTANPQLTTELVNLIVFLITPRRGPHRKHRSSIVAFVFVHAGTCLPGRCSETAVCLFACCIATAVLVFPKFLPSNGSVRHNSLSTKQSTSVQERVSDWRYTAVCAKDKNCKSLNNRGHPLNILV